MAILAGDIGATKTILAMQDLHGVRKQRFASGEYASFDTMLRDFLQGRKVTNACFGVAGPVVGGRVTMTHLRWTLDERRLRKALGCPVRLVNDVEAMAHGLSALRARDAVLIVGRRAAGATKALLAPGTGLGMAFVTGNGVMASEGGHADFAPRTPLEWDLKRFLLKKGYAGTEAVLSGPGLLNIHAFLTHQRWDDPARITEGARRNDRACIRTMTLFLDILARETQRIALTALGGVYLAGGVVRHLLPFINRRTFAKHYLDHPRMRKLLSRIPVQVVVNDELGLLGALRYARVR